MRYRNVLFIPLFILSFILSLSFFLVSQGISVSANTKEQRANIIITLTPIDETQEDGLSIKGVKIGDTY